MIAFSGVRSSWLMLAMKRDLASFAASAASFAFSSSVRVTFCCVTSRRSTAKNRPLGVVSLDSEASAGNSWPFLRNPTISLRSSIIRPSTGSSANART